MEFEQNALFFLLQGRYELISTLEEGDEGVHLPLFGFDCID